MCWAFGYDSEKNNNDWKSQIYCWSSHEATARRELAGVFWDTDQVCSLWRINKRESWLSGFRLVGRHRQVSSTNKIFNGLQRFFSLLYPYNHIKYDLDSVDAQLSAAWITLMATSACT